MKNVFFIKLMGRVKRCKLILSLLLLGLVILPIHSQNSEKIRGKVTDLNNDPLIGVSVHEVGTSNGTITDIDGNYAITLSTSSPSLKFTYVGFSDQEVKIDGRNLVNIQMQEQSKVLEELVVVGYGRQRKSDLTGAISSMNVAETLKKMPTSNVSDLLQGRISGLSVVRGSGAPGADATVRVRGVNSIRADGGPLVVVDGFPGASLGSLNPADIQSIEVLKDASSTAIYGSRGANGVILITTKTPREGRTTVNYNGYIDIHTPYNKPKIMNAGDFALMANDWNNTYYGKNLYNKNQVENFKNGYDTFDYMDALINDVAINHSHDLSISGGNKSMSYLFSTQYTREEGIAGKSYNNRVNYRLKLDADITKKLKFGANFYGIINSGQPNTFSGFYSLLTLAQQFPQTVLPYDKDGKLTQGTIDNTQTYNPMGFLDEQKRNNNENKTFNNWFQTYLDLDIYDGLSFRTEFQLNIGNRYTGSTSSSQSFRGSMDGYASAEYADTNSWGWRNSNVLNYTKEFNAHHRINAMIGMEQSEGHSYLLRVQATELDSEKIGWKNLVYSKGIKPTANVASTTTSLSYFGRVNYVLMDRYMITGTIRRDGSSLLAYENRWDNFPSFSLAWDMKKETFLENVKPIEQLKLRYGYGVSGNQAVPAYSAFSSYEPTKGNDGIISYTLVPGNPNLRWEKTYQSNYGFDSEFLKGRLLFSVDYYTKRTDGVINDVVLPDDTGQATGLRNSAEIKNKGVEVTLAGIPVSNHNFYWKADLSLSYNQSKITKLDDIDSKYMELGKGYGNSYYRYYEGEKIGSMYGLQSLGVWSTADINNPDIPKPANVRPGSYRYKDQPNQNGEVDGIINADDYVIIGNGQPTFNWGLNNQFTYKDFDLNILIVGFHGFDIYNYPRARLTSMLSPFPELLQRFIPGENENAVIASFGKDRDVISSYEDVASSNFVEKGSFVKLKNITLGYSIPKKIITKAGLSSLRAYFSVQNVHTFTDYSGNDPELAVGNPLRPGLDMGSYPSTRQYLIGLNVSF